jgi:signal transduction histidine kinase/CheY-like chemotaxis protein
MACPVCPEGLIAQVWESRAPVWRAGQRAGDFSVGDSDPARPGLSSGFAIPLLSGEERLGVLCCSLPRRHFDSQRLRSSLAIVGLSLGELLRRSRAEMALKESETSLFQALKAVPFPLCIIEEGRGFQLVSDVTYQLTGLGSGEIRNVEDWTTKVSRGSAGREAVLGAVEDAMEASEVRHHGIFEIWTAAGQRALWDFTTAPLVPSAEGRRRMVAVAYDVSEREANRHQLEESARHKDGFLAMLGHELRNPLAAIRNGVQLVAMADSQADHDEAMGIIDRQSSQMALMIDRLLDLNRISLGKVSLEPVPLNLTRLLKTLTDDKRRLFQAKGLELLFEPGPTAAWTRGDAVRMVQVVDNLLGNSLKFMEAPGAVSVSLSVNSQSVEIKVKDTGQGMTPELAAVVFEPFRQGEQTLARPQGGLGLGLSLVKQIVELHGGTVEVFSEGPGLGCEFRISLSSCAPVEEASSAVAESETLPLSILYVEDDLDLALSLGRLLEAAGHEVRHALDATVALDLVAARPPQVILCDLGLAGEVDGYGLLAQFQMVESLREVPVVAVTGYGLAADKARVRAAGFAAHLTKPFEAADLQRLLRELPRPQAGKLPRPDFCRILVVDDNRMIAQGTAKMLAKAGFEARYAFSGAEALQIAEEHSPHLALLDLGLPDCDGPELKEKLTLLPCCQGCVYLAVTGSDEAADIERTRRAGFAAHLVKPVSLQRLLEEFDRIAMAELAT